MEMACLHRTKLWIFLSNAGLLSIEPLVINASESNKTFVSQRNAFENVVCTLWAF